MVKTLVLVWLVVAAAIGITAALMPSVEIEGGVFALLAVSLLFGLVNAVIGPLLRLLSLPLTLMTFGLFALVVNGALLALTAGLSDKLEVGGFLGVIVAAVLISILSSVLTFLVARTTAGSEGVATP